MTNSRIYAFTMMFVHHKLIFKLDPEVILNEFAIHNNGRMHLNDCVI